MSGEDKDVEAFMKGLRKKKRNRKRKNRSNEIRLRLQKLRARKEQLAKDSAADEKRGVETSSSPRVTPRIKKKQITSLPYLGQITEVRQVGIDT